MISSKPTCHEGIGDSPTQQRILVPNAMKNASDNSEKTSDSEKSEDISSKQHSRLHLDICEKEGNSKDHIKATNLDSALDCQQISSSAEHNVKIPPRNVTMNFTECKNGLIDWKIDQLESIFKDHVFMCTVVKCKCRFKTLKGLQYHHLCHDAAANFKCPQCNWISRNWQPMKKHLWESHKVDIELFTCDICGYKTPDIPKLTAHKNTHPEGILICIKCGMETIEKPELSSYDCIHYFVRKQQSDESNLNYQPEIHRVSTPKNNMKNYAHFNKHKYKCKVCDYNTSTYSDFRIHQRIHFSSKLFRCSFCSEHFSDKLYYRHHLKNKHSTDKLFPCFVCNRIFLSIENLKSHASLHKTFQNEEKNDRVLEESDSQQNIHDDLFFKNDQKSAIQLLTSECNLENSYVGSSQKLTVQNFSKIRLNLETSKLNQVNEPSEMNSHPPPLLKIKEEPLTDEIPNLSASVSHDIPGNESTMQFDISLFSENSMKVKKEIIDDELNDFVNSNVNGLVNNSLSNESLNTKTNRESASNSELLVILFDDQNNMIYNSHNDISKHLDIPLKHRGKFNSLSENTLLTNDHDSLTSLKNIKKIKSKKQKTNSPIVKTIIDEKIAKLESMFESYKHICPVEKCNCRFKTLEGLTYHQWCHNLTENNFKCPECNSTSRNWQPMKKHLWEKHRLDVELFECDLCSYKTACIAQLTSHRHCHSEKQLHKPHPVWKSCSRIRLPKC